jgi:small-conductance mechanosensitive channel
MASAMMERGSTIEVSAGAWRWTLAALCAAVMLVTSWELAAADTQSVRQSMPLKVGNRVIIKLYGPLAGHTAEDRATSSMERIERVLAIDPHAQVKLEDPPEYPNATRVSIGGRHAFLVTPIDIDEQAGETTQAVAREAAIRLEGALVEWREQRTPDYLAKAAVLAVAATLLFGLSVWLLFRANRWIAAKLRGAGASHSDLHPTAELRFFELTHVLAFARLVAAAAVWIFALLLAIGWITFVLERFPYTRPWGEGLEDNLVKLLKDVALAIVEAMPGLLIVAIVVVIARIVIRTFAVYFRRVEEGRAKLTWLDAETAAPTRRIFSFVVWIFALAMAYPYLPGANTDAFKGLSVLVGIMISLGGASVVGQAFSGLILMYAGAFRRGDFVRIGNTEGTVVELGMFVTRIRTGLGEEITLPNSGVMAATTKNFSRTVPGTGYIVDTAVTIGYSTPWRQVEAMLLEAARRTPDIADNPPPFVRQTALSDFYIEYRLAAYTPAESPVRRIDVLNKLHANIQDAFNEHGVQIMSPHYVGDPSEPQVVKKEDWYAAPARQP